MIRWLIAIGVATFLMGFASWWVWQQLPPTSGPLVVAEPSNEVTRAEKRSEHGEASPQPALTSVAPSAQAPRIGGLAQAPAEKGTERKRQVQGPKPGEQVAADVRNVTPEWVTNRSLEVGQLERITGREVPDIKPRSTTAFSQKTFVIGADTLRIGKINFSIGDVVALPFQAYCLDPETSEEWPCGRHARADLRRLIRAQSVTCTPESDAPEVLSASLEVNLEAEHGSSKMAEKVAPQSTRPKRGVYTAESHIEGANTGNSAAFYNPGRQNNSTSETEDSEQVNGESVEPAERSAPFVPGIDEGTAPLAARAVQKQTPSNHKARETAVKLQNQKAHCVVGGIAIGPWLVERGWAVPAAHRNRQPAYANAHQKAQRDKAGLWRDTEGIYCKGPCRFNQTLALTETGSAPKTREKALTPSAQPPNATSSEGASIRSAPQNAEPTPIQ